MHKIKRVFTIIFTLLVIVAVPILTYARTVEIIDNAMLYSPSDIDSLEELMQGFTEFGDIKVVTGYFGSTSYSKDYVGDNGTVFFVDMDSRQIYIYSKGSVHDKITSSKARLITDNVYSYFTRGEYYDGTRIAIEQMIDIMNQKSIPMPMKHICNFFIALIAGFAITFTLAFGKGKNSKIVDLNKQVSVKHVRESIRCRITAKVRHSGGSGHGGGGGHSGGGGGHSGGGGGGHGF